jgi:DNA primase
MDVKRILSDCGVEFTEHHPSVSKSCVGVDCPFCKESNKHCGVFLDSGYFSCFKCGSKGTLYKLIQTMTGMNWDEYSSISGVTKVRVGGAQENLDRIFGKNGVVPPAEAEDLPELQKYLIRATEANVQRIGRANPRLIQYLSRRTFDYQDMLDFKLHFCIAGPMINRLIIPIPSFDPVGYLGRDFTGMAERKYLATRGLNLTEMVYSNGVAGGNFLFIVEGVFDSWAIRNHEAVALFGKVLHQKQIPLIVRKPQSNVVICLDSDALKSAHKIRDELSPFFPYVSIMYLPKGEDPSSLGPRKMREIIRDYTKVYYERKESHGKTT